MNFQKKYALPCLLGVFLLPVWLFSRFKRLPLSRVSTQYSHIELGRPVAHVALLRISPDRDLDSLLHSRFQCRHATLLPTTLKTAVQQTTSQNACDRFLSSEPLDLVYTQAYTGPDKFCYKFQGYQPASKVERVTRAPAFPFGFEVKKRPNDEERDFRFWRKMK